MTKPFNAWNKTKQQIDQSGHQVLYREGEIWWTRLGINIGIEQNGKSQKFTRPVLILRKVCKRGRRIEGRKEKRVGYRKYSNTNVYRISHKSKKSETTIFNRNGIGVTMGNVVSDMSEEMESIKERTSEV